MTISLRVKLGQGFTLRAIVRLHVRLGMQAEVSTKPPAGQLRPPRHNRHYVRPVTST